MTSAGARRIVLGVTGGIAAYKSAQLLRLLIKAGHDVVVVPTEAALHFVGAATFAALSGHPVRTSVFEAGGAEHVRLGRETDLVIVAPATADFLARAAAGRADDLLAATLLMARCPVLYAPAMHTEMWHHPATRANIAALTARGATILGPASGPLAGGDAGEGRMVEPDQIAEQAAWLLTHGPDGGRGPLTGVRVLVTAGGTREAIDPVRFIANRSSGRQGIAIAAEARRRGADVSLIGANLSVPVPPDLAERTEQVVSAAELAEATLRAAGSADVVVMTAAVADFRPAAASDAKLKRAGRDQLTLTLERTEDILAALVGRRREGQTIVGFAAETGDQNASALELGRAKARAKGADLLVCNEVGAHRGFEVPDNEVVVFDSSGRELAHATGTKEEIAAALWDTVAATRRG